jgi:DNA helicase-2/ATP-dependent DNA helicase PcrA
MNFLKDLNPEQQAAVMAPDGPVLVLAGAGSGKTRVIAYRAVYLLLKKNLQPGNLLIVTFTNKAAEEMRERILMLSEKHAQKELTVANKNKRLLLNQKEWAIGTFHAIALRILRREAKRLGFFSNFVIYDELDSKRLITAILKKFNLDPQKYQPQIIASLISGAKNELVPPSEYQNYANNSFLKIVSEIYKEYQKELKSANAMDFDDLLFNTVYVLENFPEVKEFYQNLWQYILVDEYQDTNTAQYRFLKILAEKRKNIFAVGDDCQAIYSFRGANFRNILNFQKDWPAAQVCKLTTNYRSTQKILDAAYNVILNNQARIDKKLVASKKGGAPVFVYEAYDEEDEAYFVINEIKALKKLGILPSLNEAVVLYRTNAQSRALEEACLQENLPYRIIGGLRFYERKEIKDILAYLRLIALPTDQASLLRIINVPPRGIGEKTLKELNDPQARILNPKLRAFFNLISELRDSKLPPKELIDKILEKTGYIHYLKPDTKEGEARLENVLELKTVASRFTTLEDFLDEIALLTDLDLLDEKIEALPLMTLHQAKGLEFNTVFMVGMEEGIFPHSKSLLENSALEEERRLCYVGMTRAKNRLYLIYALQRELYGSLLNNQSSRFLTEIPEGLIEKI